jgi:hypothetical protein
MFAGSVLIIFFLVVTGLSGNGFGVSNKAKPLRVLFIGNSLTYSNDLPAFVEAFAKAAGQRSFSYKTVAFPNFSLEDHWNNKDSLKALKNGPWDFVVMQQGPSASKEGRAVLLEYARRFAGEIRKVGGRPAFYSVWPSVNRMQDFKGVRESYREAADELDGLMLPVGEAWLNAWKVNSSIGLYSTDGFHPSPLGTYLAGLVIYEQLYNQSPIGLPAKLRLSSGIAVEVPADTAVILQRAAQEANRLFGRH